MPISSGSNITKCRIDSEIIVYHQAVHEKDDDSFDYTIDFEYLGEGTIYSVDGVRQGEMGIHKFLRRKEKHGNN